MHEALLKFSSPLLSSDGNLVTSCIPTCSNDSATVEVVARSYEDTLSEDRDHSTLFIRIDYICIGEDGQQVSDNLQIWGAYFHRHEIVSENISVHIYLMCYAVCKYSHERSIIHIAAAYRKFCYSLCE